MKDWMIKESQLDDDQLRVLNSILDKSCIVSGCAGSGKSVLALIKAQRIQKEKGDNYVVIAFTRSLARYMQSGKNELKLSGTFTYHWNWKNRLHCQSADYVIVDEIQDFDEKEIREFIDATNKNFFFFGDTAQSIYENLKETMSVESIGYLLPQSNKPMSMGLYRNYRLPLGIAKFVQYIGVELPLFEPGIYKSKEKTIPYVLSYKSDREQDEELISMIKLLNDVAILLPTGETANQMSSKLQLKNIKHEVRYNIDSASYDTLDFTTSNPKVITYHSAKGLQFENIIIPYLDSYDIFNDSRQKALYVAMTRTYKNLYIMYSGSIPDCLENIPHNLYKTKLNEEIDDK